MRLFIALNFDANTVESLCKLQSLLRDNDVEGNFTKTQNLHMTLAFIGEYGNPHDVLEAMEQVDFRPFDIAFDGVGSFGELFWVGLKDNPQLEGYVKKLRRALAERDIPFDRKRFSPHITLIRKYSYKGGREIPVSESPQGHMKATRVSLMRSERGKHGMIYTEIGAIE